MRKDNKGRVLRKGETQRKNGSYLFTYTDIFKKRRYIYAQTLPELRKREDSILKDRLDGMDSYLAGSVTLNYVFDRYISTKYELRETTKQNYLYMYNHFVRDKIGNRLISSIKYSDIRCFYLYLLHDKGLKPNTVDTIHTVLHPTFQLAVRDDVIRKNPSDGVMAEIKKKAGKNKGVRHALTIQQQREFLNYIAEEPVFVHWLPLFTVLLGTGGRIGEIIGLRWEDIDYEKRIININHSIVYYAERGAATKKSVFHVSLPKTRAGIRDIPMMNEVYDAFHMEYDNQKTNGFNCAEIDGMTDFIFCNRFGNVHNAQTVNRTIKRIVENHNAQEIVCAKKEKRQPIILPNFSCHHLRHTFCTRLCENETNLKVIQSIMGHENIETTMDIYAEATAEKNNESMKKLSEKFSLF